MALLHWTLPFVLGMCSLPDASGGEHNFPSALHLSEAVPRSLMACRSAQKGDAKGGMRMRGGGTFACRQKWCLCEYEHAYDYGMITERLRGSGREVGTYAANLILTATQTSEIHTHTRANTHTQVHSELCVCVCVRVCTYLYICLCTYVYRNLYTCIYIYVYIYLPIYLDIYYRPRMCKLHSYQNFLLSWELK